MKAGPRENASFQCMECRHRMECSRLPALADQDTERHLPLLIWREADFPALPCSCPADLFSNQGAVTQTHFLYSTMHTFIFSLKVLFRYIPNIFLKKLYISISSKGIQYSHTFSPWRFVTVG